MLHTYFDKVMSEVASAKSEIERSCKMGGLHADTEENKEALAICEDLLKNLEETEMKLKVLMEKR